ncbi:TPA: fimbrial protein [Pseudomonas aeruginosa]|uniref:fimbrial protein n=1 Tax=Pseudomonas TaxID=286 RepID=UPI001A2BDB1A|nr:MULTISPECIES: fimbrial protein [Pseudomonas]EKV6259723.1 type 1 fimbrial protein [Pseudomonas aeruginosa]MBG7167532.1 type 1 fimbrial protein [Pseudomonas aeruginosa]MBH8778586.1 type 1 fimbrial protein [Pseudomonas aeruginosa]MBI8896429.1 type 1 fimbrial protein [Pseudomonas aeruginosa]MBW0910794.1 type 1 fimbrial protein [Pseudomonas aeruginosa]
MEISKKAVLAAAVFSLVASGAMAADGVINFKGSIVAASCSMTGGTGTSVGGATGNQSIDVDLGKVSLDSLGGAAGGSIVGGNNISLNLDCGQTGTGLTTVKVKFDPASGSGIDTSNASLLKVTGTATGVGIGIYNSDGKLLNLSANESIDAPLVGVPGKDKEGKDITTYSAALNLRAAYVKSGTTPKAGTANGTLPFTITYN